MGFYIHITAGNQCFSAVLMLEQFPSQPVPEVPPMPAQPVSAHSKHPPQFWTSSTQAKWNLTPTSPATYHPQYDARPPVPAYYDEGTCTCLVLCRLIRAAHKRFTGELPSVQELSLLPLHTQPPTHILTHMHTHTHTLSLSLSLSLHTHTHTHTHTRTYTHW